ACANAVYDDRRRLLPAIAAATGLTPEGVEFGFGYLERSASDGDLRTLVDGAGDAARVHVVLSANVFVAPLRALALARAAAPVVTVRPSPRDPILTRELVERAADSSIAIVDERDVAAIEADHVHVYGRDVTIDAVRRRVRPPCIVRAHGTGMGIAFITRGADPETAAKALAPDVVAFDQRGCLSPRIVVVEGDDVYAECVASALHGELDAWAKQVPRGTLFPDERAAARRWFDTLSFAGRVWSGAQDVVALAPTGAPLMLPPPGRHVHVAAFASLQEAAAWLAPAARFVVAVGTDDPTRVVQFVPPQARLSPLGRMQCPPLDGPVDRRGVI
ncbi:MAG TPA: acyl-CoA reductase, partial [Polyangiaceae bacterium]|nr:acyl-CoA reductase [Polyangiaceae bacterium]